VGDPAEERPPVASTRHGVDDESGGEDAQAVSTRALGEPDSPEDQQERHPEIPEQLAILPVRNVVSFPGTLLSLNVGRAKSKALLDSVLTTKDKIIGVVAQRFADAEDPLLFDLYRVGTACRILKLLHLPDASESIVVHGLMRMGIVDLVQSEPYLVAKVRTHQDRVTVTTELEALMHGVRQTALRIIELSPNIPDEAAAVVNSIETVGGLADFLASNLQLDLVKRQELLETFDAVERLKKVHTALTAQVELMELSEKIQDRVRGEIDKSQRRYFLQEQLKAIQTELGEMDARTAEIEQLRERLQKAKLPEEVAKEANRELDRLAKIPQASPEYSVAHDYINWLADLPWKKGTRDALDLKNAARILDQDHYGLEKVKKRIQEFLAVRKLRPAGRGPILCLIGPPGVGKTSLGQSIARALKRKFIRISLGGIRDEAEIRGHRRTYIGAIPGRIIQEIRKAGSNNPVFMLDEVDKIGVDFRGDPASALLEVLDPQQNHSFTDHYLDVPFDLSRVMFIATANYADPILSPLRDRMEIIDLPGYTHSDKMQIAKRYLLPRQIEENGLSGRGFAMTDAALDRIIASYTREAGVRELERQIGSVCRAVAAKIARKEIRSARIDAADLADYLGPVEYESEVAMRTSMPGVVTGLAYTPVGGDIIFVEASMMPGRGSLSLTGQMGDVMRESASAAYSLVRSRSAELGLPDKKLYQKDFHIHVPAGAVPKDGPSAGLAMFTSLVSLLQGRPTRADVAMTGEITLRGLVLPVGGIKEKVLAAHRAGIKCVVLPGRNRKDLSELPAEVRGDLKFVFADRVGEALNAALEASADESASRKGRKAARGKAAAAKKSRTVGPRRWRGRKSRAKSAPRRGAPERRAAKAV